jgi:creatinine amidohydrolase
MTASVRIEELTWMEIERRVEDGTETAILDCAATEQHGTHMPMGVDTFLGDELAERVARELGDALVAPTLRPGCSEFHADFPGTLSLSRETFVDVLADYCDSLADTFEYVVLLTTHGGNTATMAAHVPDIAREHADDAEIFFVAPEEYADAFDWERRGVTREQNGHHAGYSETALMLAARPELVDVDAAEAGMADPEFYDPEREPYSRFRTLVHGLRSQSENGIMGDPRGATAEEGEALFEARVAAVADAIRRRREADPMRAE